MKSTQKRLQTSELAVSEDGRSVLYKSNPSQAPISSLSKFGDQVWWLDIQTPGQIAASGRFDWDFEVSKDLKFSNPIFNDLRNTLKKYVWSLFCERNNGYELSTGSLWKVIAGVKSLVRWMHNNNFICLDELTSATSLEYLDYVQEECRRWFQSGIGNFDILSDMDSTEDRSVRQVDELEAEEVHITEGQLRPRLQIWGSLWGQKEVMLRFGRDALPEAPFGGKSVKSLSRELATKAEGWIPPVPDEVALPVMHEAHRWVYDHAEDILKLQELYLDAYDETDGLVEDYRSNRAKKVFGSFEFSIDPLTGRPWRDPVAASQRLSLVGRQWEKKDISAHEVFRTLVQDLCAACVIILQSEAGPRINEVCGLKSGDSPADRLPGCIELRSSKTGLNQNFYLKGLLSKLQRGPREVEWLLGSQPGDSEELPAPVRAVWILERLYEPLRKRAADPGLRNALILQFTAGRGFPRNGEQLGRVQTHYLRELQREFIGNNVDLSTLPDSNKQGENLAVYRDSMGACLKTHSWRKTFALYVYRTDSRMTPAIAQQFHHISLAMTEEGYLGSDPTLLAVMDSVQQEQTALVFFELARGERPSEGRMAKLIDQYRDEFLQITAGETRAEGLEAAHRWVIQEDLRIWFSSHGKCFFKIAPAKSRCHLEGETVHWANTQPNFASRSPDACLGCPLYAVDGEHKEFWRKRFQENSQWLKEGAPTGGARLVGELRVRQSRAVLRAIGVEVDEEEMIDD